MQRISSARWAVALCLIALCPAAACAANGSKFLRFVPDDAGGGRLETSVVTYRNADGVRVDLVGAVHIADAVYYAGLNDDFRHYDSVLYEMVKPRDSAPPGSEPTTEPAPGETRSAGRSLAWVGIFQRFLRDKLNLTFQLEQIDYDRPNFVHADLDIETFLDMQAQRGESFFKLMLRAMLSDLGRDDAEDTALRQQAAMGELLMALQSPDRARRLKVVLAKQFDQIDEMMSGIEGPNGSVIIGERNRAALKVLKERIEKGDRTIAIFYGAGHLKLMEKTLTGEMGFEQIGQPKWRTAWDMTAPATQPATAPALR